MEFFSGGCDTEKVEDNFMVSGRKYRVGKFVMRDINKSSRLKLARREILEKENGNW